MQPIQFGTASIIVRQRHKEKLDRSYSKALSSLEKAGGNTADLTTNHEIGHSFYVMDISSTSGDTKFEGQAAALTSSRLKNKVVGIIYS